MISWDSSTAWVPETLSPDGLPRDRCIGYPIVLYTEGNAPLPTLFTLPNCDRLLGSNIDLSLDTSILACHEHVYVEAFLYEIWISFRSCSLHNRWILYW